MMILATTTIMVMLLVPMMASQLAIAATYNADNMVVNGVLASDTYVLYPYEDNQNLIFGFSKYGELINGVAKQGLEYRGLDVFANPNVLEKDWSQGWLIEIHYADLANTHKHAWAYALYTDLSGVAGIGGDWNEGVTNGPLGTPYGGRKTNVWATTDDIKVLYDGPRRFVALTKTTIYDAAEKTVDDALVSVTITFVFNKVKKIVILYKDIKRLDEGKFGRTFQVEFSNRGEWDIGTSSAPPAYAHFYDNLSTKYDGEYHEFYNTSDALGYDLAQMIDENRNYVGFAAFWPPLFGKLVDGTTHITRDTILNSLTTIEKTDYWSGVDGEGAQMLTFSALGYPSSDPYPIGLGFVSDEPQVFINNVLQTGGGIDYTWDGNNDQITFTVEPANSDQITVVYKHEENPEDDDMALHIVDEPDTPYVIGEWAFDLENEDHKRMFRAVTVYGVVDQHNGDDDDRTGGSNVIDQEVQYLLDETFNPYDLQDSVHKDTRRWVYIKTLAVATGAIALPNAPLNPSLPTWGGYSTFAERVLINGVLQTPLRDPRTAYGYTLTVSSTTGVGTITFKTTLAPGTHVKILWSTRPRWSGSGTVALTDYVNNTADATLPALDSATISQSGTLVSTDPLGLSIDYNSIGMNPTINILNTSGNFTETLTLSYRVTIEDFKVLYDPYAVETTIDDDADVYASIYDTMYEQGTYFNVTVPNIGVRWFEFNANSESTVITNAWLDVDLDVTVIRYDNGTNQWTNITASVDIDYSYSALHMGQYEWAVVGTDAATIDSLGAAYVTQAFDSKKQIHVRMTGLDIRDTAFAPNAPYVMANATTNDRDDYYYNYPIDMRSSLKDDWCTSNPVSSSNLISVGGPRANLATEYFNEFTMAFYALGENVVTDIGQANKILALSCWDKHVYGSGYAVISVYIDLNGTVGFLIWGVDGQDTYYATKWFWDSGIYYLQQENPGVTDIILKITYPTSDPIHPSFSIVERLGTISHKPQHDCPVEEIPV